ncbi:MAG: type ISP restriction/modification enzyme [Methylocella sp.]
MSQISASPPREKMRFMIAGKAAYRVQGGFTVEAARYSPEEQTIWINKTQFFSSVPQAVWDFHIGGYQVLDKYLKSRKGRALPLDEMNHVSSIVGSLAFTIAQLARIDAAYRAAFPDRRQLHARLARAGALVHYARGSYLQAR